MTKQESFFKEFFPDYFIFETSEITDKMVKLKFVTKKRTVICPHCHKPTTEYVTYYIDPYRQPCLSDIPVLPVFFIISFFSPLL